MTRETDYRPRWLAKKLQEMVEESSITVLTGARQVGKSTLLLHELHNGWGYYNLDDLDIHEQIRRDPVALLSTQPRIIVDEVQKEPLLLRVIKNMVDQNINHRFVLSGSANLMLMSQASESLAGRSQFLELPAMTTAEILTRPVPEWLNRVIISGELAAPEVEGGCDLRTLVWRGGMPAVLTHSEPGPLTRWRDGYVHSYLERDLRQLSQIDNLIDFRRLMSLAALRTGQVVNQSDLARDAALSQPTAHRYLNLMEVSGFLRRIPPFLTNLGLRLVKSPKIIWNDSGLAAHLGGYFDPGQLVSSREWGGLVETFIYQQLQAVCETISPKPQLFFWRTRTNEEVDIVCQYGRTVTAFEIKSGADVQLRDTVGLQSFMKQHQECRCGILLYSGDSCRKLTGSIWKVPIGALWAS